MLGKIFAFVLFFSVNAVAEGGAYIFVESDIQILVTSTHVSRCNSNEDLKGLMDEISEIDKQILDLESAEQLDQEALKEIENLKSIRSSLVTVIKTVSNGKIEMASALVAVPESIQLVDGFVETPFGGSIFIENAGSTKVTMGIYGMDICNHIDNDENPTVSQKAIASLLNSLNLSSVIEAE